MSLVKEHYDKLAKKSAKQRADGGENVKIDLLKTHKVRFTKDFGKYIKAGTTMTVSDVAYQIYSDAKVIEDVK